MGEYSCTAELPGGETVRTDLYIAGKLRLMTRSQIKARALKAYINSKRVKISCPVKNGDRVLLNWEDEPARELIPENIALDIIYEDEHIIVVNKPQGMVVHPAAGNRSGTLANAIYGYVSGRVSDNTSGDCRPGGLPGRAAPFIVHRLDKDTSGVIITALDIGTQVFLQNEFKERRVQKKYIALCCGSPACREGILAAYISRDKQNRKLFTVSDSGKYAVTKYKAARTFLFSGKSYTLFLLKPLTGRTHQLRVHLKHLGCPILGDPLYNTADRNFPGCTLMLHARKLLITLPGSGRQTLFKAPVPQRFRDMLEKLKD